MDASDDSIWQSYSGGVITVKDKCSTCKNAGCLDHGVSGLGYGTTSDGIDYFQVKNSWGADWGMGGYILLERGAATEPSGVCGVLIDNQVRVGWGWGGGDARVGSALVVAPRNTLPAAPR